MRQFYKPKAVTLMESPQTGSYSPRLPAIILYNSRARGLL